MDMTWLGHACFRMRGREGVVLTDPPDPKSGHAIPKTEASLVTMSHDHPGHASLRSVGGEPVILRGPGEYEVHEVLVTGVGSFHDDDKGSARGRNTVFAIRLDDLVICHLGDLGHALPAADLEKLGDVDIALVPISGPDTNLSAARAAEVVHQLEPKVVVHADDYARAISNVVSAASGDASDAFFFVDGLTVFALALFGLACAVAAHALFVSTARSSGGGGRSLAA